MSDTIRFVCAKTFSGCGGRGIRRGDTGKGILFLTEFYPTEKNSNERPLCWDSPLFLPPKGTQDSNFPPPERLPLEAAASVGDISVQFPKHGTQKPLGASEPLGRCAWSPSLTSGRSLAGSVHKKLPLPPAPLLLLVFSRSILLSKASNALCPHFENLLTSDICCSG